jgi:hypothetical protein
VGGYSNSFNAHPVSRSARDRGLGAQLGSSFHIDLFMEHLPMQAKPISKALCGGKHITKFTYSSELEMLIRGILVESCFSGQVK